MDYWSWLANNKKRPKKKRSRIIYTNGQEEIDYLEDMVLQLKKRIEELENIYESHSVNIEDYSGEIRFDSPSDQYTVGHLRQVQAHQAAITQQQQAAQFSGDQLAQNIQYIQASRG